MTDTKKPAKSSTGRNRPPRLDGRSARRCRSSQGDEGGGAARPGRGRRRRRRAREDRRDAGVGSRDGRADPCVVKASAPDLAPTTYYGMPAYARDGKVVCFFPPADKFKARYATFGFNDDANSTTATCRDVLGADELTAADEKKIGALVKKAVT